MQSQMHAPLLKKNAHRAGWLVATGILLAVLGIFLATHDSTTYRYRGRSVAKWFSERSPILLGQEISFDFAPFADDNSQAFKAIGTNAVPLLLEKLRPSPKESFWERPYANTLAKLPYTARQKLQLPSPLLDERFMAVEVVYIIGPDASGTVPGLISVLKDKSQYQNSIRAVVMALGSIGPSAHPAVPILCKLLETESPPTRITSQSGGGSSRTSRLRPQILKTLGQIGPGAKQAIPQLIRELDDYPTHVAEIEHWAHIHNTNDISALMEKRTLLASIEKKNRLYAAWSLVQIDPSQRPKVVPILIELLRGEEFWNSAVAFDYLNSVSASTIRVGSQGRTLAAEHLGELGATEAIPELKRALASEDPVLSKAAAHALDQIAQKTTTPHPLPSRSSD